jgi:uncharacterized protein
MKTKFSLSALALLTGISLAYAAAIREIDWDELLPESARNAASFAAPTASHDYLGESAQAAAHPQSSGVNGKLAGQRLRLPGFIAPLEIDKEGRISEFFLVPYFGACIHVPPPPANQIVYVKMTKPLKIESLYDAYWITGKMLIENKTTSLGAAAYRLEAERAEIYDYE